MDAETTKLARRAVASPWWRWMPGMAARGSRGVLWRVYMGGGDVLCAQGEGAVGGYAAGWNNEWAKILGAIPDLSCPATRGCLLDLVRKRRRDPSAHCALGLDGRWRVWGRDVDLDEGGDTEAAALVAALDAPRG